MSSPKKIILLANHNNGYAVTEYFLKRKDAEIVFMAVLEDPPGSWWKSVKKLAITKKIPHTVFENNEELYKKIKNLDIDYIISASWRNIVPKKILNLPKLGSVNMHNSLLPKYRGAYANSWPLYFGERESGVTLHYMTEKFDDGDIIWQEKFTIDAVDTAREVWEKCNKAYFKMIKSAWPKHNKWPEICKKQIGKPSFYSMKDFTANNEIDIEKNMKIKDFINYLRAKSFEPYYRNAYFLDRETGKKIQISINLSTE